jgi:heme exporter protein B
MTSGSGRRYLRATIALIRKDLVTEIRSREAVLSMGFFALLVVVIFGFTMEARQVEPVVAPGMLWVAFSFAGVLGLNRSFGVERENGCITGLMLCPVDRSSVFVAKMATHVLLMTFVECVTLPVFSGLLHIDLWPHLPAVLAITLLGTLGFAAVGTLLAAVASQARARDVLLPIILYPIWIPLLLAAVKATSATLEGSSLGDIQGWLRLMGVYDLLFLVLGVVLFEYVLEE